MKIEEKNIINSINLSEMQKVVLVKVLNSSSPNMAYNELTKNIKLITSRDILSKLGIINYDLNKEEVRLTNKGFKIMTDNGLIDNIGELTDIGKKYLSMNEIDESFELFREINLLLNIRFK